MLYIVLGHRIAARFGPRQSTRAVIPAIIIWLLRRESGDSLMDKRVTLILFAFAAVSYFVWLRFFAISSMP